MFENQAKPDPSQNDPKDMFEGVDNSQVQTPPGPLPKNELLQEADEPQHFFLAPKVLLGAGVAIVILVVAVVGVQFFFFQKQSNSLTPAENTEQETTESTASPQDAQTPQQLVAPQITDTDGDSLLDDDEIKKYRTNPFQVDTDADELSDREEVNVYSSDPLKEDTDGDGFSDGQEVKNGYNPNGPGKLLSIPPATPELQ